MLCGRRAGNCSRSAHAQGGAALHASAEQGLERERACTARNQLGCENDVRKGAVQGFLQP